MATSFPMGEGFRTAASALIAGVVLLAIVFPSLSAIAAPYAFPALFVLLTSSLCGFVVQVPGASLWPDRRSWVIAAWQLVGLPLVFCALAIAELVSTDTLALVLISATASSTFAAGALAELLGLDVRLVLRNVLISTLLSPLSLLAFGLLADGTPLVPSLSTYIGRVGIFVVVPALLVLLAVPVRQRLSAQVNGHISHMLQLLAFAGLLVFSVGLMSGVADLYSNSYTLFVTLLVTAMGFVVVSFVGTAVLFYPIGARVALTAALLATSRNLGLSYAVLGPALGSETIVYIAVFHLPMLLAPALLRLARLAAELWPLPESRLKQLEWRRRISARF